MKKYSYILLLIPVFLLSGCNTDTISSPLSMGKSTAPILIEEFSDIECSACSIIGPQVEQLVKDNSDIVRLEYYHFPLSYHEFAFIGAEAVECAEDQGKGWKYLASLFENQKYLSDDFFYSLASTLKLNESKFKDCLESHEKRPKIVAHQKEGRIRSLPGTPTLFINGQMVRWSGYAQIDAYIKGLVN